METIEKCLLFVKLSAECGPANFRQKHLLLEAEHGRLTGDYDKAAAYYQEAIRAADESGYLQQEAMAYELTAKFYIKQRKMR